MWLFLFDFPVNEEGQCRPQPDDACYRKDFFPARTITVFRISLQSLNSSPTASPCARVIFIYYLHKYPLFCEILSLSSFTIFDFQTFHNPQNPYWAAILISYKKWGALNTDIHRRIRIAFALCLGTFLPCLRLPAGICLVRLIFLIGLIFRTSLILVCGFRQAVLCFC